MSKKNGLKKCYNNIYMKFDKNWSEINEKNYTWLYNYMKKTNDDLDEFTFIDDNKRNIMSVIENNIKWSDASKESLLFTVAKYLKNFGNQRYAKLYSEKAYKYMQKNRNKENENKQDEKELINYRDHEYFIKIIDDISYESINTIIYHYQYLILCLLVLQPPLRTNFYISARIIRSVKDNDHINNFVLINKRGKNKAYYIVNNDKVSKTKTYSMNKNLSTIDIINQNLIDLICNSYEQYPRTYLFELNNKPITETTYLNWLRNITHVEKINNDMMRSSYINWFYDHNKELGKREKLATEMRHSVMTAQRNYLKIDSLENEENKEKKLVDLQIENNNLKELVKDCNETNKTDDALFSKRKRDIIYNLNVKKRNPRESTLNKYNIVYDNILKKYI